MAPDFHPCSRGAKVCNRLQPPFHAATKIILDDSHRGGLRACWRGGAEGQQNQPTKGGNLCQSGSGKHGHPLKKCRHAPRMRMRCRDHEGVPTQERGGLLAPFQRGPLPRRDAHFNGFGLPRAYRNAAEPWCVSCSLPGVHTTTHATTPSGVTQRGQMCESQSDRQLRRGTRDQGATDVGMLHVMMPKQRALPCHAWEGPCQSGNIDRPVGRAQLALSDDATATRSMFC